MEGEGKGESEREIKKKLHSSKPLTEFKTRGDT